MKKHHVQCCEMSLNFYLHTFAFNIFSILNTLYLHNQYVEMLKTACINPWSDMYSEKGFY